MKKKILSVLLAGVLAAFSLAGCSSSSGSDTEETDTAETEEDSDDSDTSEDADEEEDSDSESSTEETESASAEYEISSVLTDLESLTDANGDEIALTSTEEYEISGNYSCNADNSAWAFCDGVLAVGYEDDDGTPYASVCEYAFYIASEDANGDQHVVIAIHNLLYDTTTLWYVMNMIDEDENALGVELVTPGDDDIYIVLYTADTEDDSDSDSEDSDSEDSDSEE